MLTKPQEPSAGSTPASRLQPNEAERNRLHSQWVKAHWHEIEEGTAQEQAELRKQGRAWVEAELAKSKAA